MTGKKRTLLKNLYAITKATVKNWWKADPFRQSAVVAYYAVFSIPALLVIVIAVAGLVFGEDAVRGEVSEQIKGALGNETAKSIENIIANVSAQKSSVIATIIGIATLIIGSTGVFTELQISLNQIWGVQVVVKKKWLKTIKSRLFSFGLVLSLGFLMLVSLLLTTGLEALSEMIRDRFPDFVPFLLKVAGFVLSFGVITVLFALMFKVLPDAKIKLRDVWIGAMVTTLLFILGKFGLGIYFAKASPGSAYGAAGSIILVMLWVSYSCMILFLGAEFTKQYATFHGHEIQPTSESRIMEQPNPKRL
ncbi:YihY/virulence factor BrkB family protein [Fluviicola chungangensis]|uniref:YihY/virulence factor BrkB family protein n=1 Tax=Fluviicola chungangensis TaxID=2597671 RepID=A0A556N2Y7_9FLAO|nr:YihY/virulence factor BrkB family protein [Fluviicola chungangensis]TSJ46570.1 YihY/virulence factor BrkB family protein [Fluviicola chungangensis]